YKKLNRIMKQSIKLAIAEDQPLALKSIMKKLSFDERFDVVFVANNGIEFLEKFERYGNDAVDVVLMDIEMPQLDGIQTTKILKEKNPALNILILTTFDDDDKI